MDKLKMVNENDNENIHHLFTHGEVKRAIMRMTGEPNTDEDYRKLDEETERAWRRLPQYQIKVEDHNALHKAKPIPILEVKNILSKRIIGELVEGGIKSFENDKKEKVNLKSSLVKRVVGLIYGYIHNYEGIRDEFGKDKLGEQK